MMSPATIREIAREAASKARRQRKEPFIVEAEDKTDWLQAISNSQIPSALRSIPNLGDYRPKGWKLITHFMVDKSGAEPSPGEWALGLKGFVNRIIPGKGYAIIEEGQFQVVIGEFEPKGKTHV